MESSEWKKRTRVNLSTSVKGVVTPDVTIEMLDADNEQVLLNLENLYSGARDIAVRIMGVMKDEGAGDIKQG